MEEPVPSIAVLPAKKPHGGKGRVPSEKQMEGLRKGMEILKLKREDAKKKKEEKKARIKAGEVIEDSSEDEAPQPVEKPKPIIQYVPVKPRKERKDTGIPKPVRNYVVREDFESFKTSILESMKNPVRVEERIKEVPVDRVVEKFVEKPVHTTKVLSGSDLLNAIFFK